MEIVNLVIYIFCYAAFFVHYRRSKINNSHRFINDEGAFTSRPRELLISHTRGICLLGLVPVLFLRQPFPGIFSTNHATGIFYILLYILIFMAVISIAIKQSEHAYIKRVAPLQHSVQLSGAFLTWYFITRVLFLFVYELWFRGYLLFESIDSTGIPAAVALNILLYVLLHLYNSKKEILACALFGLLVCFLNILLNAVWPAIFLHISFSLIYEINFYRCSLITPKTIQS